MSSLFSQPLRYCPDCGTLYDHTGELIAAGAAETEIELKTGRLKDDMIGLRDGFGAVVVGSGITVAWTILGPLSYDPVVTALAAGVGVLAMGPFGYFFVKVRRTKKRLREWRRARKEGQIIT